MDDIEIIVSVRTSLVGSQCEETISFDRLEWEVMSDDEKDDACRDIMLGMIEWNYKEK